MNGNTTKRVIFILAFLIFISSCKKERQCHNGCYIVFHGIAENDTMREEDITAPGYTICKVWSEYESNPNSKLNCNGSGCTELVCP